jgi:hypothetical protein
MVNKLSLSKEKQLIELPFKFEIRDVINKQEVEVIINEVTPEKGIVVRKMTKGGLAEQVFIVYFENGTIKWVELK